MRYLIIILSLFINTNLLFAQKWIEYKWHLNPSIKRVTIDIDDIHFKHKNVHPESQLNFDALKSLKPKTKVKVAIIDGGVDFGHKDLIQFLAFKSSECFDGSTIPEMKEDKDNNGVKGDCLGFNFFADNNVPDDEDGHGTHVAGIIAEPFVTNSSNQLEILPIKIFGQDKKNKKNLRSLINQAIRYAIGEKVDIIHLSMGWPHSLHTAKIDDALKLAQEKDILVVSSAGNSGQFASIYPCQIENVVCIGALGVEGKPAIFSNHGKNVDFYLPGEKILSTVPSTTLSGQLGIRGIDYKSGTSQAAPLLSGIFSYVKSAKPYLTWAKIINSFKKSVNEQENVYSIDLNHFVENLKENSTNFILPNLKQIELIEDAGKVTIKIPIHKYGVVESLNSSLTCNQEISQFHSLNNKDALIYSFKPFPESFESLQCKLHFKNSKTQYKITLPLYKKSQFTKTFPLSESLSKKIIKTRAGIAVKFYSIPAIAQSKKKPYFFSSGDKKIQLYHMNQFIRELTFKKECRVLRLWQRNDTNIEDQLIVEKLCEKKYIQYDFYSVDKKEIKREIQFFPKKTIVNYENLIIKENNHSIIFEYLSPSDLTIEQKTIFTSVDLPSSTRLVQLRARKDQKLVKFEEKIINQIKSWSKDLKLRYIPNYRVILRTETTILVEIENQYALIDRQTQKARWAGHLNQFLIGMPKVQILNHQIILSELITPYDFQYISLDFDFNILDHGFYQQQNLENPLIDTFIVGDDKPKFVIKSFYDLIHLSFDQNQGNQESKTPVDRFDFLGGVEQQSLLTEVNSKKSIFIVDGSTVHENRYSLYRGNERINYQIPKDCRSLSLVKYLKKSFLPLICWDKNLKLIPLD